MEQNACGMTFTSGQVRQKDNSLSLVDGVTDGDNVAGPSLIQVRSSERHLARVLVRTLIPDQKEELARGETEQLHSPFALGWVEGLAEQSSRKHAHNAIGSSHVSERIRG